MLIIEGSDLEQRYLLRTMHPAVENNGESKCEHALSPHEPSQLQFQSCPPSLVIPDMDRYC